MHLVCCQAYTDRMIVLAILGLSEQAHVPDPVRAGVVAALDRESRLALFQTCTKGRDLILSTAANADLTLLLGPPTQLECLLQSSVRALQLRAGQAASVTLLQNQANEGDLHTALEALTACNVRDLRMPMHLYPAPASTRILAAMATACPELHSIYLGEVHGILPPFAQLPGLQTLQVDLGHDTDTPDTAISVSPYLPQLSMLIVSTINPQHWHRVINTTSTTLKEFRTGTSLCGRLIPLLVQHAPALQKLVALDVQLRDPATEDFSRSQWPVTELCLNRSGHSLTQVARLPQSATGSVVIDTSFTGQEGTLFVDAADSKGLSEAVRSRLSEVKFLHVLDLVLEPSDGCDPGDQPAALKAALQQLPLIQSDYRDVWLGEWEWTEELCEAATTCHAAGLPRPVHVQLDELHDDAMELLLEHLPWVEKVAAEEVTFELDHSDRQCGWRELTVEGEVELVTLMRLPRAPHGLMVNLRDETELRLQFSSKAHPEFITGLCAFLGHVTFREHPDPAATLVVSCTSSEEEAQQPALLKTQLQVVQAMRVEGTITTLRLVGWSLDAHTMDALADLPAWASRLEVSSWPEWPGEPGVCKHLSNSIPTNYTVWHLQGIPPAQLEDVCTGLAERRAMGAPTLVLDSAELAELAKQRLSALQSGTGEGQARAVWAEDPQLISEI